MKITFISDIHCEWGELDKVIQQYKADTDIFVQLGDLCIFNQRHLDYTLKLPNNFYFIHGNHSNPPLCAKHPNFFGRYGFHKEFNLFFISGAWSIDKHCRVEGRDWFADEELSNAECNQCFDLYSQIKPDYVISHDAPSIVAHQLIKPFRGVGFVKSTTNQLLDALFDLHQPKLWMLAHHHVHFDKTINGTRFICQPVYGATTLDILSYKNYGT